MAVRDPAATAPRKGDCLRYPLVAVPGATEFAVAGGPHSHQEGMLSFT